MHFDSIRENIEKMFNTGLLLMLLLKIREKTMSYLQQQALHTREAVPVEFAENFLNSIDSGRTLQVKCIKKLHS